jgi:FHS family L-fucose permease-like MFS transporter
MMIMGGGFVSVFQGYLSGKVGILNSYWVGVVCFAYLAYYAWRMKSYFKQQGISLGPVEGGH